MAYLPDEERRRGEDKDQHDRLGEVIDAPPHPDGPLEKKGKRERTRQATRAGVTTQHGTAQHSTAQHTVTLVEKVKKKG